MPCSRATVHGERAGVNSHCPKNCSPSFKQQPRWKQMRWYWNKTKVMTWISMFMCPEQNIKHISLSSLQADSSKTLIWILYKCLRIFALLINPLTPRELNVTGNSRSTDPGSVGMNILTTVLHRSKMTDVEYEKLWITSPLFFSLRAAFQEKARTLDVRLTSPA